MDILQTLENLRRIIISHSYNNEVFNSAVTVFTAISLVISITQCFFGYKLLKWWTSFLGFITFAGIGYYSGYTFKGDTSTSIICAAVLGIMGSLIAFSLYKFGVLLIGFSSGFLLGYKVFESLELGIALGIAAIVLLIILMKPVLITFTAVSSAIVAGKSLSVLLDFSRDNITIITILLAISGIIFQWITNGGKLRRSKSRKRSRKRKKKSRNNLGIIAKVKDFIHSHIQFEEDDDDEYYDYDDEDFNYDADDDKTVLMPRINDDLEGDKTVILKNNYEEDFKFKGIDKNEPGFSNKTENLIKCPKCSNLCSTHNKFCHNCGNKLN